MTDRDILELIATQVGKLTTDMTEVKSDLSSVKSELSSVKADLSNVKAIVIKIEHDHGQKLGVLFDGQAQNSERLARIEAIVSRHEEIILRRIK